MPIFKAIASSNWCMLNTRCFLVFLALQLGQLGQQDTDVTFCPNICSTEATVLWSVMHMLCIHLGKHVLQTLGRLRCTGCPLPVWTWSYLGTKHSAPFIWHRAGSGHTLQNLCWNCYILHRSRSLQGAPSKLLESPPASAMSLFSFPCTFTEQYCESSVLSLLG